ncbi:MAG: hypothetical protein LBR23_08200 [Spirochaetaceae bacterium]|nr:hypothetical protein [Spirochaetaceae bacterium]
MKKTAAFWMMVLLGAVIFAETNTSAVYVKAVSDRAGPEIIQESFNHGLETLTIRYFPVTNEAIFVYSCRSSSFDEGKAVGVINERVDKLTDEKGFTGWTPRPDTRLRSDKTGNTTSYTMFVTMRDPKR